jgi:MFS family permease
VNKIVRYTDIPRYIFILLILFSIILRYRINPLTCILYVVLFVVAVLNDHIRYKYLYDNDKKFLISLIFSMCISICLCILVRGYTGICVGGMISYPAEAALVSEMSNESERGTAYGMYKFAIGIGGIIGPLIGVSIYQYLSKDVVFYIQGAALIIICVLIGIVLKNKNEKETIIVK